MYKATIIGHYGGGLAYYDGQTIKTKKLTKELIRCFGESSIKTIDTHGGIKSLLQAPKIIKNSICESDNVIMLPAHRGVQIYAPLLFFFKKCNPSCRIHYVVVGGWLPEMVRKKVLLKKCLKTFTGIYVETKTMKEEMETMGFSNIFILPNFIEKNANEKAYQGTNKNTYEPYALCTFSRVLKEKGIGDAVDAVNRINKEQGKKIFTLDIYGPIDETEREWFNALSLSFNESVCYKGVIPSDQSSSLLSNYFALLFPTHYYTEGIPGTILDAYAARLPVISAKWKCYEDVVDEGITGYGYEMVETEGLYNILERVRHNPSLINDLRENCGKKYKKYTPSIAVRVLIDRFA